MTAAKYQWIENQKDLEDWIFWVRQEQKKNKNDELYVDTEADSLYHYQEKLCLIQVNAFDHCVLIDTLIQLDLSPLIELFDQSQIWFHSADYDLTLLKRTFQWMPKRLNDTQVAAKFLGYQELGLAALLRLHFQVELDKASQKEDWSERPLSENMLSYAADDVRYLPKLAAILVDGLKQKYRYEWYQQYCSAILREVDQRKEEDQAERWRIKGLGAFNSQELALIRELWLWREEIAKAKDIPTYKVYSNKQLIASAERYQKGQEVLPPPSWRNGRKQSFKEAVRRFSELPADQFPPKTLNSYRKFTLAIKEKIEKMQQVKQQVGEQLQIDPSLLISRSTIEALAQNSLSIEQLQTWQQYYLKEALLPILNQSAENSIDFKYSRQSQE
jgi:ribonuclease D